MPAGKKQVAQPDRRLAVLIDADNIPAAKAGTVFAAIAKIGRADIRRLYGDFSQGRLRPWAAVTGEFALTSRQVFAAVPGKNAADIAMVIDAMDLLAQGGLAGFCLVSSDSDFTALALRLRESGLAVHGFGAATTAKAYRAACTDFTEIEPVRQAPPKPKAPDLAGPLILRALATAAGADGWAALSSLGTAIRKLDPAFRPNAYGHSSLIKLVKALPGLVSTHGSGAACRVRLTGTAVKALAG